MQAHIQPVNDVVQIPLAQRRQAPPSLAIIERQPYDRNAAMIAAYATGGYSYQKIADYFGVYFTTVGKLSEMAGADLSMIVDLTVRSNSSNLAG